MTANKKINLLMKKIAQHLANLTDFPAYIYYNQNDEAEVLNWPSEKAQKVWNAICKNAPENGGLAEDTSPFCLFHNIIEANEEDCIKCGYCQRHGCCDAPDSDYRKCIHDVEYRMPINEAFSKEWCIATLTEILSMED